MPLKITPRMIEDGFTTVEDSFTDFFNTLKDSIKSWDYFVNWEKVFSNTKQIEIDLNLLNYLLGKDNFDQAFRELFTQHPQLVQTIPSLIVRDGSKSMKFEISDGSIYSTDKNHYFDFSTPATDAVKVSQALTFVKETGLVRIFQENGVKNLVDYVLGVEAGLDSNGRKNRSGSSMERIVGNYLKDFSQRMSLKLINQASQREVQENYGIAVPIDKASRAFDFVIGDSKRIVIIETNYYSGGGSKLKATCGEYKGLSELLNLPNVTFLWITDGKGWETDKRSLQSAYEKLDHVWNLSWLSRGYLSELL